MTVRGKFFVIGLQKWPGCDPQIKLGAVYRDDKDDSENTYFHKATPSGTIEMTISNPDAAGFFNLGDVIYVDFTKATQTP